jgi:membrane fusion protein (multidrug efflux system)
MSTASEAVSPSAPPRTLSLSGKRRAAALVVALVLVGAVGIYAYRAGGRESTDDALVEGHVTPVGARVGGAVSEVLVKENQEVRAGDVLVRIDPRDYDVALSRARAELADAEAAVAEAQNSVPIVEATTSSDQQRAAGSTEAASAGANAAARDIDAARARLRAAEARVVEAKATADRAARDRDRLKPLAAKEEISQQQYDAAASAAAVAEATVASAQASVAEAQTAITVAESRHRQSEAGVRQAVATQAATRTAPAQVRSARAHLDAALARVAKEQAAVKEAELKLEYTVIKAPSNGIVSRKSVEPGQILQAGQPLLALVGQDEIWVVANFKETQLASIHPGQHVSIAVDALGGDIDGTVESIAAATGARFSLLPAQNASGNFVKVVQRVPVKIAVSGGPDVTRRLRPGLSVVPTIYTR